MYGTEEADDNQDEGGLCWELPGRDDMKCTRETTRQAKEEEEKKSSQMSREAINFGGGWTRRDEGELWSSSSFLM